MCSPGNKAGITRDASFRKMTPEDWDTVLRTNLDSMFNMTKQVIEDMLLLGWGRIVNVSSVNGQKGAFGQANYAASKAGIHGFTKCLALEFAKKMSEAAAFVTGANLAVNGGQHMY